NYGHDTVLHFYRHTLVCRLSKDHSSKPNGPPARSSRIGLSSSTRSTVLSRLPTANNLSPFLSQWSIYLANPSSIPNNSQATSQISQPGILITSAALAGLYVGLFSYEQNRRWKASRPPFHFISRLNAHGFDKFGHFYASKAQAKHIANLYRLSGLSPAKSNLLGVGIAFSVQTLIEIKDGRIPREGFDLYDQAA